MSARLRFCLSLCPLLALAQTTAPTGAIRGVVTDSGEGAIAGVVVTATNEENRVRRTATTDSQGRFYVANLPTGAYALEFQASLFAPVTLSGLQLSVGQVMEQRVRMTPAGVVEKIEVSDQPEAIDTTAASASVALGSERIEEAPARGRNYLNFVLAAPGVAPSAGTSSQRTMTGVRSPRPDSGFAIGGMRARNNAILIDGMDNRDETTGGNRVAVGLEMVQEFRVASTAVGAELGGAAGAMLNMVTRSGVNLWHGDVTFFTQNERFNARRPEAEGTPQFRRYQPGVSLLGPVRRDRTFFAAAIEHESETAEEWSGTPRDALEIINAAGSAFQPAFRGLYDTRTRGTDASAKFNHQIGANDTLSLRHAFSRGRVRGEVQGPDNFADRSAQGSSLTTDHSFVGDWLRLVSPSTVNILRLQLAGRDMSLRPNGSGPMMEVPGVVSFGSFYLLDSERAERHYQVQENLNLVARGHRLSLGADAHLVTFRGDLRNKHAGLYVFPTLDDLRAGRPDLFIQAFGSPHTRMTTLPAGFWLQDRWEPRPGLHLEIGLRYDHQRMPSGLPSSSHNLGPRVGVSWRPRPSSPLVLRLGGGLFYDRYPLGYLNDALQKNGVAGFDQYAAGSDAVRAFTLARGGAFASPLPGLDPSAYQAADDFPSTYGRKLTVGFERALDAHTSLSVEASHVRGFHLPRVRNARLALPASYVLEQAARSEYYGVSVSVNRRLHDELAYLVAYTTGSTRDDGSDFDEHPLDPANAFADWARSRQHQRHRLVFSALAEVPVEDMSALPGWFRETLEGASLAPILTIGSGRPLNTLLTSDVFRTGAYPLSARPPGMARNSRNTPGIASLDLRVMKTFRVLQDRAWLQLGIESFNLTNRANAERVSPYFATPAGRPLATYGTVLESLPARQVQFLVQFEY